MAPTDPNPAPLSEPSDQFAADLRALYRPSIAPNAAADEAILALAAERARLAGRRRRLRVIQWVAAAAGLAITATLTVHFADRATIPGDINGDGRVDILDALALAHRLDAKATLPRGWDINHDGTVDRADADAVAMRAVSLAPQNGARPG